MTVTSRPVGGGTVSCLAEWYGIHISIKKADKALSNVFTYADYLQRVLMFRPKTFEVRLVSLGSPLSRHLRYVPG